MRGVRSNFIRLPHHSAGAAGEPSIFFHAPGGQPAQTTAACNLCGSSHQIILQLKVELLAAEPCY